MVRKDSTLGPWIDKTARESHNQHNRKNIWRITTENDKNFQKKRLYRRNEKRQGTEKELGVLTEFKTILWITTALF